MSSRPLKYSGKVTIVTGGSKGIGAGCGKIIICVLVKEFILEGSNVVFCSRNTSEGKIFEDAMNRMGPGKAAFCQCDVTKEADLDRLLEFTITKFGRLDCIINNAGWHPPATSIIDFTTKDFRDLLNFNLVPYWYLIKISILHLRKTEGNIINMSSLVGHIGQSNASTYVSTKGGIHGLTKAIAIEEAPNNVRCNSISPGNIWTPLFENWINGEKDPESSKDVMNEMQHLKRLGTIEECGKAALFLAADATFNTGTDMIISGGAELDYGNKFTRGDKE